MLLKKELIRGRNNEVILEVSNKLTKKMISKINFNEAEILVEYGSGTGLLTKQLLNRMNENSKLFIFETNKNFISFLSGIKDKRLEIINSDAEKAKNILLEKYNVKNVDYIISEISLNSINRRKRKRIIFKSFNLLNSKGKFITFQYFPKIKKLLKKKFSKVNIEFTLINIPPVFIFEGIK